VPAASQNGGLGRRDPVWATDPLDNPATNICQLPEETGEDASKEGSMGQDPDTVEEFFSLVADAWKTNDGAAVASYFVEDGSLINPFGQRADGRDSIAGMYTEYFGGMLQGTSTDVKLTSVRVVENTHAFVDGEQSIYGSGGEVVLVVHLAALLRRDGDSWRFVDARPYSAAAPPS
jgi:uncharacterized protein (TIGR02246 family)